MKPPKSKSFFTDVNVLCLMGLALFLLHMIANRQYGFHQDEMVMLDDALHLDWGFVEYPPLTAFVARIALELFGVSLVSARTFSALAMSVVLVLTGLMTRELGGKRMTQIVAAFASAIAPVALVWGSVIQYVTFDYLWSVVLAYFTIKLLRSENPRWWLAIGAAIGLGMMTKYTMAIFALGLVVGVLLTPMRRYLKSPWLWGGIVLSLLIFLPNALWQIQHDFISLDFLSSIHARDVQIGRADGFLLEQLVFCVNLAAIPLWIAGLNFCFLKEEEKPYRALGWMYVVPFLIYLFTRGRSYYLSPAYPMLIAAGAMMWERWVESDSAQKAKARTRTTWTSLIVGALFSGAIALPIAPINSAWWNVVADIHDTFTEQIGWHEMVQTVSEIYNDLPDKANVGILTGENDEAAALNLYGAEYNLPKAISGSDTFYLRGYGNPPPETLIVIGFPRAYAQTFFETCEVKGTITNQYGVENDLRDPPDILLCRAPRYPWPELWEKLKIYS